MNDIDKALCNNFSVFLYLLFRIKKCRFKDSYNQLARKIF